MTTNLFLTSPNPTSTTIVDDSGRLCYIVDTIDLNRTRITRVRIAGGEEIATLQWHPWNSALDKVTIGLRQFQMIDFKNGKLRLNTTALFTDARGQTYVWNRDSKLNTWELTSRSTHERLVTVEFAEPLMAEADPTPYLVLSKQAAELRDMCVVSWIFLQKQHRSRKSSLPGTSQGYNATLKDANDVSSSVSGFSLDSERTSRPTRGLTFRNFSSTTLVGASTT
ncbi:hypothetical protein SISNIDRAFT_452950 [Sistotremastrum niveocremeum HHB9708]|uniref:DUF6593 domain-containing protein n=1 Tax=Sistotremastrum niveocremeum HHB9708 TaxID=1314777 RepID=A0A164W865_9AGAM|nr:hypothetical protein SISNIDRAFT_452950 [Sistotremastrum niveocremeum HHB9708]